MKALKRILAWLCLAVVAAGLAAAGIVGTQGYLMYRDALSEMPLEEKIESVRAQEGYVKLSDLPPIYTQAVVAAEDRRFYEHGGFDVISTTACKEPLFHAGKKVYPQGRRAVHGLGSGAGIYKG